MVKKGQKWYAVRKGRKPGIYTSWAECKSQTERFGCAIFKSFKTKEEAQQFINPNKTSNAAIGTNHDQMSTLPSYSRDDPVKKRAVQPELENGESHTASTRKKQKVEHEHNSSKALLIKVHFDGGSRGNPGLSGAGAFVQFFQGGNSVEIVKIRHFLGRHTNNYAEYKGLICGLREICSIIDNKARDYSNISITVKGDSNLIINQMKGLYQCKHKDLKPLYSECNEMMNSIEKQCRQMAQQLDVSFEHVYRQDNKEADALANEAMDTRKTWTERSEDGENKLNESSTPVATPGSTLAAHCKSVDTLYTVEDV